MASGGQFALTRLSPPSGQEFPGTGGPRQGGSENSRHWSREHSKAPGTRGEDLRRTADIGVPITSRGAGAGNPATGSSLASASNNTRRNSIGEARKHEDVGRGVNFHQRAVALSQGNRVRISSCHASRSGPSPTISFVPGDRARGMLRGFLFDRHPAHRQKKSGAAKGSLPLCAD